MKSVDPERRSVRLGRQVVDGLRMDPDGSARALIDGTVLSVFDTNASSVRRRLRNGDSLRWALGGAHGQVVPPSRSTRRLHVTFGAQEWTLTPRIWGGLRLTRSSDELVATIGFRRLTMHENADASDVAVALVAVLAGLHVSAGGLLGSLIATTGLFRDLPAPLSVDAPR